MSKMYIGTITEDTPKVQPYVILEMEKHQKCDIRVEK